MPNDEFPHETAGLPAASATPGRWIAHCHIAEHHEGGMMSSFEVPA